MDMPKRLWASPAGNVGTYVDAADFPDKPNHADASSYVREDIVRGLAEALDRILGIDDRCDRTDDDIAPDACPAIEIDGGICHQCQARAALAAYEEE